MIYSGWQRSHCSGRDRWKEGKEGGREGGEEGGGGGEEEGGGVVGTFAERVTEGGNKKEG